MHLVPALLAVAAIASACARDPGPLAATPGRLPDSPIGVPRAPETKPEPPTHPSLAANHPDPDGALNDLEIQPERESESLIGLDEAAMRERFGDPLLIEEQPPGIRWQYASADCTIQVFFFMEVQSQQLRVLSYEIGRAHV